MRRFSRSLVRTIKVPTPFPVGPVNVYLIKRDPVTLVDAGPATPEAWSALVKGLSREGLRPRDVKRVLVTHGHHDHFGLASRLADQGAEVAAGRLDDRALRMERGSKPLLDDMARSGYGLLSRFLVTVSGVLVDRTAEPLSDFRPLGGGEVLAGDGWKIRVIASPGHTPGSLAFALPEARVLFSGDTVLDRITPNAVVTLDPEDRALLFLGLASYLETLEALRRPARRALLLTGHGAPVASLDRRLLDVRRRYAARAAAIEQRLSRRPHTVKEIVRELFPRVDVVNLFLAYSEVRGFLSVLEAEKRVVRERGVTVDRWRLAS